MNKLNPTRLLLAAFALCAMVCGAAAVAAPAIVGEASLVIGVAHVASADGVARPVARGTLVREGDRIETDAGGHVHLRFVDGARLSVRPSSRLLIENYAHSEQQPELNAIKFRLDVGVVRSITGAWGEASRERFRLNTPVAAIGVKGTDFIASSDADKTLASVFTGAIVVAPLSSKGCAASLGPCQSGLEKLLSETMKGQMIALYNLDTTPQIVALAESMSAGRAPAPGEGRLTTQAAVQPVKSMATDNVPASSASSTGNDKTVNNQTLVAIVTNNQAKNPVTPPAPEPPLVVPTPPVVVVPTPPVVVPTPPVVVPTPPVVVPTLPVVVPTLPVVVPTLPVVVPTPPVVVVVVVPPAPLPPPTVSQLQWGRMPWAAALSADTLSVALEQATASGRASTLGNGAFSLFRDTPMGAQFAATEASAQFRLAGGTGQLSYEQGRKIEAVTVSGGALSVDFARATFDTRVNISSPRLGTDTVTANGLVRPNGFMLGQGGNAYVAGALSLDGKEAGYFFDKALPAGNVSGITVWGR